MMKKTMDMPVGQPSRRILWKEAAGCLCAALAIGFLIFVCAAQAIPWHNEPVVNVCDSTVRLRVVANSTGERDNQIKLAVRDAVLENAPMLFGSGKTLEAARLAIRSNLFSIEKIASKAIRDCGSDDEVRVHFGYEAAPVRRYGAFTFPAGEYLTLRIDIGKADGRNWWCVLYPPLCLASAEKQDANSAETAVSVDREVFLSYGFTEVQLDALQQESEDNRKNDGKPVVRSALLDFFCRLVN